MDEDIPVIPVFPAKQSMSDLTQFDRSFPSFRQPEEIGTFSLTQLDKDKYRREYHDDGSGLHPLHRRGETTTVRNISLNLNLGRDTYVERLTFDEHLEHLLRWILHHPKIFQNLRPKIDIVCWRGKLHELMTTPYEQRNGGWIICACRIDGVVYLSSFENKATKSRNKSLTEKDKTFMYWGYKFEQYMTNDPAEKEAFRKPVNNFDGFHTVLFSKLGGLGILFGAEMDCYDPKRSDEKAPNSYVELKTSRKLDSDGMLQTFFKHKVMKWWAQSFVAGVPLIVVGFRDDNGFVRMTDEIKTDSIPKLVKENGNAWSPAVCMNFLNDFLQYVRTVVVEEHDSCIYKFEWDTLWDNVATSRLPPDSEYRFVPDWYLQQRPRLA